MFLTLSPRAGPRTHWPAARCDHAGGLCAQESGNRLRISLCGLCEHRKSRIVKSRMMRAGPVGHLPAQRSIHACLRTRRRWRRSAPLDDKPGAIAGLVSIFGLHIQSRLFFDPARSFRQWIRLSIRGGRQRSWPWWGLLRLRPLRWRARRWRRRQAARRTYQTRGGRGERQYGSGLER
jgi:hypothetical protein